MVSFWYSNIALLQWSILIVVRSKMFNAVKVDVKWNVERNEKWYGIECLMQRRLIWNKV